jgi:predicted TIM-barrel fold metal-dependent hydrolase
VQRTCRRADPGPSRPVRRLRLPLPDVDSALAELAYALDDLRLDGVVLFSNARGIYLGDPRFTPLFEELQRRRAVVFVHPNPSPDRSAHVLGLPDSLIDYPADVKYVLAHAGGTVPYLAGTWPSPAASTSRPARNSPIASERPSSASRRRS